MGSAPFTKPDGSGNLGLRSKTIKNLHYLVLKEPNIIDAAACLRHIKIARRNEDFGSLFLRARCRRVIIWIFELR